MPQQMRRPQDDPPDKPEEDPQEDPQKEVELSPKPNQGAARGKRDKVTQARVEFREREEEEEVNWRRELNLREAQIREVAKLRALSRASRASTIPEEDDH